MLNGIPQGTVLGTLLFVVYINDILDNVESEDPKIYRAITSKEDAQSLQSDLNALEEWSDEWLLRFHLDRYQVLTLGKFENIIHAERHNICNKELEHMFEEKDLGVIIDSEPSFSEHISSKVGIANAIVGLDRRSFSFMNGTSFKKLYTAFVRPHLEYAQTVWSPHLRKHINVQIRATKLVDGLGTLEYSDRLKLEPNNTCI